MPFICVVSVAVFDDRWSLRCFRAVRAGRWLSELAGLVVAAGWRMMTLMRL